MTNAVNIASLGPAMTADSSGNVGIGTSSPTGKLNVNSTYVSDTTTQMRISDNTGTSLDFGGTGGGVKWLNSRDTASGSAYPLAFQTGGTERMRISSAGVITKPYNPAFQVGGSGSPSVAANAKLTGWNSPITNVGGYWSNSTFRFTAPVSGVYHFFLWIDAQSVSGSTGYVVIGVTVNGSFVSGGSDAMVGGGYVTNTGAFALCGYSINLTLSANDYVEAYNRNQQVSYYGGHSTFGGFLLG